MRPGAPTSPASPTRRTSRPRAGAFDSSLDGGGDAFVAKLSADGSAPCLLDLPRRKRRRRGLRDRRRCRAAAPTSPASPTPRTSRPRAGAFAADLRRRPGDAFVAKLSADGSAPRLLDLPRRKRASDVGVGIAVDAARERLRHRLHRLGGLPDHARAPSTADLRRRLRRLRREAERRTGARLPTRPTSAEAAMTRARGSPSTRAGAPTSPASPSRRTSRPARAPSSRPRSAAASTPSWRS